MACCGQRITKNKRVVKPDTGLALVENQEFTEIVYTGENPVRVIGCYTGNVYRFSPYAKRTVETNDAVCMLKIMANEIEIANVTEAQDEISNDYTEVEI